MTDPNEVPRMAPPTDVEPMPAPPAAPLHPMDRLWVGLAWLLAGHLAMLGLSMGRMLYWFGLAQFIYAVPISIYFIVKRRRRALRGLLIGVALGALINGACTYAVFSSLKSMK